MEKVYASIWKETDVAYIRIVQYYAGWMSVMTVTTRICAVEMTFTK